MLCDKRDRKMSMKVHHLIVQCYTHTLLPIFTFPNVSVSGPGSHSTSTVEMHPPLPERGMMPQSLINHHI